MIFPNSYQKVVLTSFYADDIRIFYQEKDTHKIVLTKKDVVTKRILNTLRMIH